MSVHFSHSHFPLSFLDNFSIFLLRVVGVQFYIFPFSYCLTNAEIAKVKKKELT